MTKDSDQTSLQQDFLANHLVSQENNNLKKITEISGKKLLELSKSPELLGLLEKMLMESLNSISTPYLRTWKVQTTPQGALILALKASVLHTKEKESGLLPTPTQDSASERTKKYKQGGTPLTVAVQMLPTPKASGQENPESLIKRKGLRKAMQHNLTAAVQMLPTPTLSEHKYRLKGNTQQSKCLESMARRTGGKLNQNFVEYLMGFQQDWTKIEPKESKLSETQSAHKSHSTSDKS